MLQLVFLEHHSFELVPCDLREVVMEAETILQPLVQKGTDETDRTGSGGAGYDTGRERTAVKPTRESDG